MNWFKGVKGEHPAKSISDDDPQGSLSLMALSNNDTLLKKYVIIYIGQPIK